MKSNQTRPDREEINDQISFGRACRQSCQTVLARIRQTRDAVLAEARLTLRGREQMLRLALNEAEALAWDTLYPHLFFPDLAMEKVREVAVWNNHQQSRGARLR